MTKKTALIGTLILVVVGIAAPSASAVCNPPKFASTYNSATGGFAYWHTTIVGGTLQGQMWSGSTDYTGTCNDTGHFMYFGADPQNVGINVSLGDGCVPGCPSGSLSVKATVTSGSSQEFVATSTPETPAGGVNFDFSNTPHSMASAPRPRVAGTSRSGPNVMMNTFPVPLNGWFEGTDAQVTGCNFRAALAVTDPGRNASAYPTILGTVAATGGSCVAGIIPVDCSHLGPEQQFIVIQAVTAAGPDPFVGPATRINCNPALAEPKNKVIPRKNAGVSNSRN